ncbi:hypothetical protein ARTSIC4J27_570 [Pseudarthrobacter siccitolerans]|uniref:Uncharacterized protein n=1 Tax=Pseudarthrobacter siccitolerans TaxID=861266 RepID=A0A024GYS7_9MICC|nr:hypothetical protein ARTSIC4J27_570 [Pseudarthrobacter siccitolerans]
MIDRQELRVTLDGQELPYFYAEQGPRVEELGEGLSVLWLPIIVGGVEDVPATPGPYRSPDLWPAQDDVVARGGRHLDSYRGDS